MTYESDTSGKSFLPGLIAPVTETIYMDLLTTPDATGHTVTPDELAPIAAMELNIVGHLDGSDTIFTSGAGTINYTAAQQLTVSAEVPSFTNSSYTLETSNMTYGPLPAGYTSNPTQSFRADTYLHIKPGFGPGIGIPKGVPLATKRPANPSESKSS